MGLLDEEIQKIISNSNKLKWALCIFCRVPFLTKYQINVCERCKFNLEFYKKLLSKLMIMYILSITANSVITIYSLSMLFKHIKNQYMLASIISIESFIIGYILWKIMLKFIYDPKVNDL